MILLSDTTHLLRTEAPSAATAFILAAALSDYHARAVSEEDAWAVVVDLRLAGAGATPAVLSRTRDWLVEIDLPATSVSLDGETGLLEGLPSTLAEPGTA